MTRIAIFNEFLHEKTDERVQAVYPNGIHNALADFLRTDDVTITCYTLDNVEEITEELGLTEEEVLHIMEVLGLTMADLMKPENMMMIVMEASGETDPMALLTNAEFINVYKPWFLTIKI